MDVPVSVWVASLDVGQIDLIFVPGANLVVGQIGS
jgi:hypothetical protein